MQNVTPFHIAIPVHNLAECRTFYRETLNCEEGRSSQHWVDFNLFGHQLVIHFKPKSETTALHHNPVDFRPFKSFGKQETGHHLCRGKGSF